MPILLYIHNNYYSGSRTHTESHTFYLGFKRVVPSNSTISNSQLQGTTFKGTCSLQQLGCKEDLLTSLSTFPLLLALVGWNLIASLSQHERFRELPAHCVTTAPIRGFFQHPEVESKKEMDGIVAWQCFGSRIVPVFSVAAQRLQLNHLNIYLTGWLCSWGEMEIWQEDLGAYRKLVSHLARVYGPRRHDRCFQAQCVLLDVVCPPNMKHDAQGMLFLFVAEEQNS